MKALLCLAVFLPISALAELTIFDVRKTLAMSDRDPVYHDYYVNGGAEAGLSPGLVITVTRKLPLYDTYLNRSAGDLVLKVAKVKIIHVQRGLAVARLVSEFTRDTAPLLEDPYIMVGDVLDMATATHDGKRAEGAGAAKASSSDESAASEPALAAPKSDKPVAQISVNSVDLSSQAIKGPSRGAGGSPVDAPMLH